MKVAIKTLGCRSNQFDSTRIEHQLSIAGYEIVSDKPADIYIINTCTVTHKSDSQSRQIIKAAAKQNRCAKVIVTGCYADISPEEIKEKTGVELIFTNEDKENIVAIVDQASGVSRVLDFSNSTFSPVKNSKFKTRANLKVQDGCNNRCSYCIIHKARGESRSYSFEQVIDQAVAFEDGGVKEVIVTGIHLADYNWENRTLADLLEAILLKTGLRIRISSLHPDEVDGKLFEMLSEENVCRHIHLSMQSCDSRVLSAMNRSYNAEVIKETILKINKKIPGASIGGDIIAGFPTETEQEFNITYNVLKSLPITYLHVFPFSPRRQTPAADMKQLPSEVIKKRAVILRKLGEEKSLIFQESQIGEDLNVLFERFKNANISGYSDNYLNVSLEVSNPDQFINKVEKISIIQKKENSLTGKISGS